MIDLQGVATGETCYREGIFYKIVKRRLGTDTPVQTFYFFSNKEKESFVDSQVRYDTQYEYTISLYTIIFGYQYELLNTQSQPTKRKYSTE